MPQPHTDKEFQEDFIQSRKDFRRAFVIDYGKKTTPEDEDFFLFNKVSSALSLQKQKILEVIESKKKKNAHTDYCVDSQDGCEMCDNGTYNNALEDIIKEIQ